MIAVVVPALDESGNIGPLVAELRSGPAEIIIVVDNGSSDGTYEEAEAAMAIVVSEPRRGYGYACSAGSDEAMRRGADVIVYIDADHSSKPSQLADLVAPILAGDADLVLGTRRGSVETGAMPPHQRFGNWLSSKLMGVLYDLEVTDLGPYRALRVDLYRHLGLTEMTFGWPTEMMVSAANARAEIVEVPVAWLNRNVGKSKVGGTVRGSALAAWYILTVTVKHARYRRRAATFYRGS